MRKIPPPSGLRVSQIDHNGERLVVFSFPPEGEKNSTVWSKLTSAELEVVLLVLDGQSSRDIARVRGRAVATVNKQIETAYRKLGVASRTELVVLASRDTVPTLA